MSSVDKLFQLQRDEVMLKSKWVKDWEKGLRNQETPDGSRPRCEVFKHDWERCADGINFDRAKVECRFELEDLVECMGCEKQIARTRAVLKQRDKLIKEGKYTAPPFPKS